MSKIHEDMIIKDNDSLLYNALALNSYNDNYGKYIIINCDWEFNDESTPLIFRGKKPPTRTTENYSSYIDIFAFIQYAVDIICNVRNNKIQEQKHELILQGQRIEHVIKKHLKKELLIKWLDCKISFLRENLSMFCMTDIEKQQMIANEGLNYVDNEFHFEQVCYCRDSIENIFYLLERYFSLGRFDADVVPQMDKLKETDINLSEKKAKYYNKAKKNIKRLWKKQKRTFPYCPYYIPESFWWYIRY